MKKLQSLKMKMPLIISGIVSIMIIILIIIVINIAGNSVRVTAERGFTSAADGYAALVDLFLEDQLSSLRTYTTRATILDYYATPTEENADALSGALQQYVGFSVYLSYISVMDIDGTILLDSYNNTNFIGINMVDELSSMWQVLQDSNYDYAFSDDISLSDATGNWILPIFVGIKNTTGQNIGVIMAFIDITTFNRLQIADSRIGNTGRILLVNETGKIVLHPNTEWLNNDLSSEIRANLTKEPGLYSYVNREGIEAQMVFSQLATVPWHMVVAIDSSELLDIVNVLIMVSVIVAAVAIIILFIFITLFARTITTPLAIVSSQLVKLAHGDLTWEVSNSILKRKDEFGLISKAQVDILEHLGGTIKLVTKSTHEITSAAAEILHGNIDLSKRTETQAASLEETASSMEEMASAIKISSENATEGNNMMNESRTAVKEAGEIIVTTASNIEEVYEASQKIGAITKIIENIAFQTNILALNAAVEAARAGEQGRGFAVVASEVRSLAQTTQSSVKDITTLIVDSNEKIKKATDTARESQAIFITIEEKIETTSHIMNEISIASNEQQEGVNQINKAITEIDITTQQNAALVEESTATSETLSSQAIELNEAMKFFKVEK